MKKLKLIVILMCFFTLMFPVGLAQDLINNPQEYEDRIMDAASSLGLTFEELQYITLRIREITSVYESGDEIRAVNQLVQISEQYPDLGVISACEGIFQDYYATFEEKGERHYVHASLDKVFSESTDIAEGMGSYMGGSVQQTLYNIDDWWNIDEARDIVIEMIITHYPNATIDNEVIECIQIGKNSEGKMEAFFPIITTDEIVPGERIIPVRTCIYADRTDSHIADVHLEDTTNLIYDKSGYNGKESLYSLGEFILINGNNCKHTERYYKICTGHKITEYVVKTEKVKHKVSVKVTNMESKEHVIKGWIITNREYGSGLLGMPKQIINGKVVCGIEHSYGDYNKGFLHCGCIIVAEECTDCDIEKARTNPECGCRVGKIVNKMPQIVVCSCLDGGEKICGKDGNPECTEGPEDESEIIDKIESTDEISCGNQKTTGYGGRNYPVKVDFKGFKILCEDNDDDNSKTINSKEFAGDGWINAIPENKVWRTMGTIVDIEDAEYDPDKGTFYGEIIATCDCCKDCTWSRRLYFGDLETETFYNLTVKVTPNTSGTVKVTGYMDTDGDGKSEDKKQTVTITNQKTMRVKAGSNYNIVSTAGNGYEFRHLVTAAGNKITTSDDYDYVMPPMDTTIVAHFVPSPANGYTLYVNSNEGGRGYTEDRPSGTEYTTTIAENGTASIITEKITGVKSGTEFTLKYEAEDGYEFSRWEYRPFVEETYLVSTKDSKIKMPASDLVATAIFVKKSPVINETNPILTVTVNNESWGTAYALVDGVPTTLSEVVPGTEYQIVFDANDGYYFTNWVYDSVESPFVDGENGIIVMPPHDLEITGLFAPLPPPDEENRNSSVKFVAETTTPEDKIVPGTVPENLPEVAHGAEVTLGVTANTGYEFVKWYITDTNNNKLTPDLTYNDFGSGIFIMPMQDVIAHAVFKKVDKSNLTIKIIGEGSVTADGNDVPNGGIVTVTTGDTTKLIATPEDGSKFLYWMDEDGNIISYDEELNYTVNGDTVIYAVFAEKKYYTLYISSMNGGEAYTFGNENHPEESIIKITDALGKTVYKIENVMEGERFTIYYDVDSGFTFDKWEYKPYIIAEDEVRNYRSGNIEILMPASDLTVTAVFKNDNIVETPELRVTTNNAEWGRAWAVINGKETKMDKTYPAIKGEKYTLYYDAEDGYYFVNWSYSTTSSPFVDENEIVMPDKNLEVMALFSPIPEPEEPDPTPGVPVPPTDKKGHSIDFMAMPPEGGSIPEDLGEILPGSKVTIGVTPNKGWEFAYWYFENSDGEIIEVIVHYEQDGSGYFIMPDEDVKAIAVFMKTGRYKLYVTYTLGGSAWVMDRNVKTTFIEEAIAENIYDLGYQVKPGYRFVGWEFRWNKYGSNEGIQPYIYQNENKAVMPYSDMTVTAKFEKEDHKGPYKLRVISNNYLWGNAWLKIDGVEYSWRDIVNGEILQNANSNEGIVIKPDTDYEVYYDAEDGYIFTNWIPSEFFTYKAFGDTYGHGIINIPKDKLTTDIDLTAYFKPGFGFDQTYNLTVTANPIYAATVSGNRYGLKPGDEFKVKVKDVNKNYEFLYWYFEDNGKKIIVSHREKYTGKMPNRNLHLIAYFDLGKEESQELERIPEYFIKVEIEGNGNVKDPDGNKISYKEMADGESIILTATPGADYRFDGWIVKGQVVSNEKTHKFTINGQSITVTAKFSKIEESRPEDLGDTFKIISVRDLRWKDYFVNGNSVTGNVITIPIEEGGLMLKKINNYPEALKMGYAVEFELTTSQLKPEKSVVIIKPELYQGNTRISWSRVKDKLAYDDIADYFKEIAIYGNGSTSDTNKNSFQAKVKKDDRTQINGMKWNWIYYLPAEIRIDDLYKDLEKDITVRFTVELYEIVNGKLELRRNIAVFEQKYSDSKWIGDVFKYSKDQSVLDDIYNNATN